jgi:hypothetical protein
MFKRILLSIFAEGPLPTVLQEVAVPVINNTVCEAMYKSAGYNEHIPHIFLCAGWRNGGYDTCQVSSHFLFAILYRSRNSLYMFSLKFFEMTSD